MPELSNLQQEIRIGSGNDFTAIETSGVLRAEGSAITWRDEYPSGAWTDAAGAAAPDLVSRTIGGIGVRMRSFDGNSTEERMFNSFEIPHDYAQGEDIEVHLHYMPDGTGTGNVQVFFDWVYCPAGGAPESQTSLSFVDEIEAGSQYMHKIKAFGNLPSNGYALGDVILFNVRRSPSGALDTYSQEILFLQCALHVPVDTNGSRQIYAK